MFRTSIELVTLAARRAAKSWLAALSIPIYALLFFLAAGVCLQIPQVGGFLIGFVEAALCAGYLSLLSSSVAGEKIRWSDLRTGMRAIWDVMSVLMLLWILDWVLGRALPEGGRHTTAILGLVQLAIAIFLNAVPEVIYLRGSRFVQAIQDSASFVMENPVAWFVPNIVLAVVFLGLTGTVDLSSTAAFATQLSGLASAQGVVFIIAGTLRQPWKIPVLIAFVHFAMVFRGLLYKELSQGSSRMRAFRRRLDG
jgi:hypothetical protein